VADEEALLRAIVARPDEAGQTWLVLADWLDEHGRDGEAELVRLQHEPTFKAGLRSRRRRARIVELLYSGVRPCVPTRTDGVGVRYVWVPPGSFTAGSPPGEAERDGDERQHAVTFTRGFWLGQYPVTQAQWRAVTGNSPAQRPGDDLPVENVSHADCVAFCEQLSAQDGRPHRLATEWEWEYACRAGTTTRFFWGAVLHTDQANYDGLSSDGGTPTGRSARQTTPVGSYPPNAWGLYDMHGNVFEWCAGHFHAPSDDPLIDPPPPTSGTNHPARGGSFQDGPRRCRSAYRSNHVGALAHYGLRLCVPAEGFA
jgi:uncharacterized protein (TIGR02996 family)